MNIGALRVRLRIPENHSLKGKRMVLRSVTSRVKNKFNVSIAEIEDQDMSQDVLSGLGLKIGTNFRAQSSNMYRTPCLS
jgi:hypothetical protein